MKVLNSLNEISKYTDKSALIGMTIGNFDGVHLGHRFY